MDNKHTFVHSHKLHIYNLINSTNYVQTFVHIVYVYACLVKSATKGNFNDNFFFISDRLERSMDNRLIHISHHCHIDGAIDPKLWKSSSASILLPS